MRAFFTRANAYAPISPPHDADSISLAFLLFGLSLVLFSSGIELFGEKIVASWIALTVIVTSIGLLLLYILHARRTPNPLISLDLFKTRTFSIGIVGNIATRLGTGCVPFLMPLMLQVGFGYQAFIAGCMMAPTALGSIIAKSMDFKSYVVWAIAIR